MKVKANLTTVMVGHDLETAMGTVTIPGVIFDVSPEVYQDMLTGNKKVSFLKFNIENVRELKSKPYLLKNITHKYRRSK